MYNNSSTTSYGGSSYNYSSTTQSNSTKQNVVNSYSNPFSSTTQTSSYQSTYQPTSYTNPYQNTNSLLNSLSGISTGTYNPVPTTTYSQPTSYYTTPITTNQYSSPYQSQYYNPYQYSTPTTTQQTTSYQPLQQSYFTSPIQQPIIQQQQPIQQQTKIQHQVPIQNIIATEKVSTLNKNEIDSLSKAGKDLFSNVFEKSSTDNKVQDLINQLKASGQKYKDLEFPPNLQSLTGGIGEIDLIQMSCINWNKIIWLRASEFMGKGYKVFFDKIEPNDIIQGALGDCYFLSTLSALAEHPERIRKIFVVQEANEQGVYAIKICDMGEWKTIIVDDYFPCDPKTKQPIFTTGHKDELWVLLLEKAWAKVYGGYAKIDAGLTRECLHDLTGGPTKTFFTDNEK